ncbi:MAG: ATP-binding protein [Thermodesulfobacteriota bacterium]
MKTILALLIDDFHERQLPALTRRSSRIPAVAGKVDVVIGMRRTGKTFFCFQTIADLLAAGTPKENILYLNFEDDRLLDFRVGDFQTILDVYFARYPDHRNAPCYFFFDEIQRIGNWELFIRRLLDTEKNVRIVLTGSSAKFLSREIATSLRGRSLATEIFPYGFTEFLQAQNIFATPPTQFGSRTVSRLRKAAADYLTIGGFPETQTLERHLRVEVLQGYIDSVLLRDIIERHGVGNVVALKHLVSHIMNTPGGRFSVNKFYNSLKSMSVRCTKNNLYEYLDHLVDAYLFYRVPIHTRSEKARMLNPAKIYAIDTGLLNAMHFRNAANQGPLLETLVFMHLRRHGFEAEYVVTRDGFETDFLARHPLTGERLLIQACLDMADQKTFNREMRGLQGTMQELSIGSGTVVTWNDTAKLDGNITVIPAWKWLLTEPGAG